MHPALSAKTSFSSAISSASHVSVATTLSHSQVILNSSCCFTRRYNVQTDEVVGAMATEKTGSGVHIVKSKGDTKGSSAAVTIKIERTPVPPELQSATDVQGKEL